MDFGTLLHTAQKNKTVGQSQPARYYSTKFEPPKKEQKVKKELSQNIKNFLAKKEAEERVKREEELRKRDALLALRAKDKKATRRVNVMLKRTKSANQSVIADAVDQDNTAVTLAGPAQPDEDDYGYVSQEASAFYNKMMEKYSKMPDEEPKYAMDAKEKAKLAKQQQLINEAKLAKSQEKCSASDDCHDAKSQTKSSKRKSTDLVAELVDESKNFNTKSSGGTGSNGNGVAPVPPPTKPKKPMPPPMNFMDLLKLAEKKQFEPILIEQKPKEEERPLTKKQKKDLERERESRERRQLAYANKESILCPPPFVEKSDTKVGKPSKNVSQMAANVHSAHEKKSPPTSCTVPEKVPLKDERERIPTVPKRIPVNAAPDKPLEDVNQSRNKSVKTPLENVKKASSSVRPQPVVSRPSQQSSSSKMTVAKGRILDDDNEDEYDSELDDFIDDGPIDEEDYSKHIREIFGYDKSRYKYVDEDDDNMESTFAQQMREEVISTKIGIMEDLEDMKMEEEHKRKKALVKKKLITK